MVALSGWITAWVVVVVGRWLVVVGASAGSTNSPVVGVQEKKSGCGGDEPQLIHADTSIRREVPRRGVHLFPCITVSPLGRRNPLQIDPLPIGDTPINSEPSPHRKKHHNAPPEDPTPLR